MASAEIYLHVDRDEDENIELTDANFLVQKMEEFEADLKGFFQDRIEISIKVT